MVMAVSVLYKKLWRETWQLRGQLLSIALVVSTGVMTVVTMRGSYDTLVAAQADYYREMRFADAWSYLVRAPQALVNDIENIPGVNAVDTRINFQATLDLDEVGIPARGQFISAPEIGRPGLNDILIKKGRYVALGGYDEVIISENFAVARGLQPGQSIRVILNGRARELDIVGVAISPEQSYVVPPGSLFPEDDKFGIFWMGREVLGPAFDMDGAFNEVFVSLSPDANTLAVLTRLDELLAPYGGLGAYAREDQASHVIMQGELDQNRVMGTAIPAVFLVVAVFLLHLVLGRLISTQRGEIAVLKAFGYTNAEIGRHFLSFAIIAVLLGTVFGVFGGVYLGGRYINLYGEYFDFPNLQFKLSLSLLLIAVSACIAGALSGAWLAIKKAVDLPPAEAMRPEAPANFKAGIVERLGMARLLSPSVRMIVRNVERKPAQGLISSLGVAMSIAILTIGMFMFDGLNYLMELQFQVIQREDLTISFDEIVNDSVRYDLEKLEGVAYVETFRNSAARFRFGHKKEEVGIQGMEPESRLRRIVNANGKVLSVPITGVVVSRLLANRLGVATGDVVQVEMLEGNRRFTELTISGVVDDFLGVSAYMSKESLAHLTREKSAVSGAYLLVDAGKLDLVTAELKEASVITSVISPDSTLASFDKNMQEGMLIGVSFLLGFAGVIAVGVIYNGARISLSERGRELASLRVMGFHKSEVATLLLGEQALITIFAIPLGWFIGYWISYLVSISLQTDLYRIPFVIEQRTYLISAAVVVAAALASGLIVKRQLDKFKIVDVLKTRE
jgi:putative ABC transport system permease protein